MLAKPVSRPCRRFLRYQHEGDYCSADRVWRLPLVAGSVRSARIQRIKAVDAIEKARGTVHVSSGSPVTGLWFRQGNPWALTWLVNLIGVDCFGHVTSGLALPNRQWHNVRTSRTSHAARASESPDIVNLTTPVWRV